MTTLGICCEPPPCLLVSVKDAVEFAAAFTGRADIIDVKDPSAGSLGMASEDVIRELSSTLAELAPNSGLSVALGELNDWALPKCRPELPANVRWAKIGLSGCRGQSDWISRWTTLRSEIDHASGHGLRWIAVGYADAAESQAPSLREVLDAAVATGCAGMLIDTFDKSRGGLLDHIAPGELCELLRLSVELRLPMALAGRLSSEDLDWVCGLEPMIVAVRSAVCTDEDRNSTVTAHRVAAFRSELRESARVA